MEKTIRSGLQFWIGKRLIEFLLVVIFTLYFWRIYSFNIIRGLSFALFFGFIFIKSLFAYFRFWVKVGAENLTVPVRFGFVFPLGYDGQIPYIGKKYIVIPLKEIKAVWFDRALDGSEILTISTHTGHLDLPKKNINLNRAMQEISQFLPEGVFSPEVKQKAPVIADILNRYHKMVNESSFLISYEFKSKPWLGVFYFIFTFGISAVLWVVSNHQWNWIFTIMSLFGTAMLFQYYLRSRPCKYIIGSETVGLIYNSSKFQIGWNEVTRVAFDNRDPVNKSIDLNGENKRLTILYNKNTIEPKQYENLHILIYGKIYASDKIKIGPPREFVITDHKNTRIK